MLLSSNNLPVTWNTESILKYSSLEGIPLSSYFQVFQSLYQSCGDNNYNW